MPRMQKTSWKCSLIVQSGVEYSFVENKEEDSSQQGNYFILYFVPWAKNRRISSFLPNPIMISVL